MKHVTLSEPVTIQAAVLAVFNMLLVLGVFTLNPTQIAAVNAAVVAVTALVVRALVTPNVNLPTSATKGR